MTRIEQAHCLHRWFVWVRRVITTGVFLIGMAIVVRTALAGDIDGARSDFWIWMIVTGLVWLALLLWFGFLENVSAYIRMPHDIAHMADLSDADHMPPVNRAYEDYEPEPEPRVRGRQPDLVARPSDRLLPPREDAR